MRCSKMRIGVELSESLDLAAVPDGQSALCWRGAGPHNGHSGQSRARKATLIVPLGRRRVATHSACCLIECGVAIPEVAHDGRPPRPQDGSGLDCTKTATGRIRTSGLPRPNPQPLRLIPGLHRLRNSQVHARDYFASGSGRIWNFITLLVVPLPVSMWNGVLVDIVVQTPRPFHPAFGSSIRPSIHFV